MSRFDAQYLDSQYDPARAPIPDLPSILQRWARTSAEVRTREGCKSVVRYGRAESQVLDFFRCSCEPRAVALFIHGGY
jgi:hypothetical protein